MAYTRQNVTDGVTIMNKDLYDNVQDGIDEAKQELSKMGGTIEVGDKPTKENTVLTIDPNGDEVVIYTAGEVDEKFNQLSQEIADLNISKVEQSDLETEVENQLDGAKADIVTQVLAQIGNMPVFGTVDDNNIITVTSTLASGDYVLKYENEDGTLTEIGTITIEGGEVPIINIIDTVGYTDGQRLSTSSGSLKTEAGYVTTGAIDLTPYGLNEAVTIRTKGVDFRKSNNGYCAIVCYLPDGTFKYGYYTDNFEGITYDAEGNATFQIARTENIQQFRMCGYGSGADLIVTINQEIA